MDEFCLRVYFFLNDIQIHTVVGGLGGVGA